MAGSGDSSLAGGGGLSSLPLDFLPLLAGLGFSSSSSSNSCSERSLSAFFFFFFFFSFAGLDPARLVALPHRVVLEAQLILPDDNSAVLVTNIGHHVELWSPQGKLSLPIDQG